MSSVDAERPLPLRDISPAGVCNMCPLDRIA